MKKWFFTILCFTFFFTVKNVYAFSEDNYRYRDLCGNFEVAGFHYDGYIDTVACFSSLGEAQDFMRNNGAEDLAIMTWTSHGTKIIDANYGLLDLTVNPEQLTYYYETDECNTRKYTYTANGPYYGDVDGGFLGPGYSDTYGIWTAHVRLANFTGWIKDETYEIVPITWIKSYSSYTVTDESIRHNYVSKIQEDYRSAGSSVIGPKPEMLSPGTYYSYDGHYFYSNLKDMMTDYKNNNYDHSVNKDNVYYNYYMYLSNHTKTTYSSVNIDEYIRNNLGFIHDIYGDDVSDNASRLYGSGTFFYYAQEKYGVNALMSLGLSRNETGNGRSYLAIMKNNGFGLNAVDSDPINGASWYATFAESILGYASHWATYGFNHPRDWRYFGPQFGDKYVGMNVKYASAAYWSEAMAANYYFIDRAFGLQDYNYYQLGVVRHRTDAYSAPSTSSKWIYEYPEAEDAVVIIGEETVNGEKWYKLQSDLNIDENFNEIYEAGRYNWNGAVYVKASDVKLINTAKNGYKAPTNVTEYQNKNYEYNLYIEDREFRPRVGISTKKTNYYYDSSLTSKTGQELYKDRYVIIYAQALLNGTPVAYLVSSNYFYSQREWVSADSIRQTDTAIGKVTVNTDDNQWTWVNYNTEDASYSIIGGLHTMSYVPVLESIQVGNDLWYKVPVNLSGDDNVYGYTLSRYSNYIWIDLSSSVSENIAPIINADNKEIFEGEEFDPKENVTASDAEDGDLTSSIAITRNTVDTTTPGVYEITYEVTDSSNNKTTKTITVTVKVNNAPVINASDQIVTVNTSFDPKANVTASDTEDGDLTNKIKVSSNDVDITTIGTYHVKYKVTDSKKKSTTKTITVEVVADREPVINAEDTLVLINTEYNPLEGITAIDPEDGDITSSIQVTKNTVNTSTLGTYEVTYSVTDSSNNTITKTISVEVVNVEDILTDSIFYFDYLKEVNGNLEIKGYNAIKGMNNTLEEDIEYYLLFESTTKDEVYEVQIDRITNSNEITRPVNANDGFDYTYSWFKGNITAETIPDGDYRVYILSVSNKKAAMSIISNKILKTQVSMFKASKYITTRNNYFTNDIALEFIIRTETLGEKTASSMYNQYNQYRVLAFEDENLHIKGTAYSYGMDLSENANVERKLIFENTSTYEKYEYDIGSITDGMYEVGTTLGDRLDKTRAWFDATLDLSEIPVGDYVIYISNKANISDYGELNEKLLRDVSNVKATINNKEYSFIINKDQRYRIEMKVE